MAVAYPIKKNEVSSFTRSNVTEGVPKFSKVVHVTQATPLYGSFIIPYVVLAVTYLTKKNEVSSFTRSKVTEGVPKFKK